MMSKKKALILDADGVIFYCDSVLSSIKEALSEMCLDLELIEEAYKEFNSIYSLILRPEVWIETYEEEQLHWQNIFGQFSEMLCQRIPALSIQKVQVNLCEKAVYYRHCHLFNDVMPFLEKASHKFELSILTNAYPSIYRILNSLGISSYFHKVLSSSDLHICKPSREIFLLAARELRNVPENIYFVDDNLENINVAQSINITSFLLRNKTKIDSVNCANNLNELWNYLGD